MMDGHIVYQGRARDSTTHFLKMGMNCPIHSNPADYYMRILSVNYPKHEEDETHIKIFTDHYDNNLKQLVAADGAFLKLPPPDISLSDKDKATPC
jgi:ABC-2 type transporter